VDNPLRANVSDLMAPKEVFDYGKMLRPILNPAVKIAEGNPNNFGVLSQRVSSPAHANQLLNESIVNNFVRWMAAGKPGKFVDFMQQRWAPIGATNDPRNLNKNWAPNVRKAIKRKNPELYNQMQELNLVQAPWEGDSYAV
jgi:hypothetical protein